MNILILDDDKLNLEINYTCIKELCQKYKLNPKIFKFKEINSDFKLLLKNEVIDIAFLDIDLSNGNTNGLRIAQQITSKNKYCLIIFITSHGEYALDAFDILSFGFLQKPLNPEKFEKLFVKAIVHYQGLYKKSPDESITFTHNRDKITISQSSIVYLEKINQQVKIVTKAEEFLIYDTLKNIKERLTDNFLEVTNGILVNKYEILLANRTTVRMKTGEVFFLSRSQRKNFSNKISK
ncbi:LytR/AlgR family response regulator transcription factor [Anaeromicropila populeti]|uniref:Stage 0 sporulation protein A homolog n=1 Tax=Anaeromicropila populeti TaxID=37658 RepID=A0A1I6JH34_9FIRM|nr:LytTR family DNA-binding domain-containing protein [Anaeromicropila populeti]SFR78174.1 two component transcriptional regulator, LytTR family [Anaeromicropila populeti]